MVEGLVSLGIGAGDQRAGVGDLEVAPRTPGHRLALIQIERQESGVGNQEPRTAANS